MELDENTYRWIEQIRNLFEIVVVPIALFIWRQVSNRIKELKLREKELKERIYDRDKTISELEKKTSAKATKILLLEQELRLHGGGN